MGLYWDNGKENGNYCLGFTGSLVACAPRVCGTNTQLGIEACSLQDFKNTPFGDSFCSDVGVVALDFSP